MPDVCPKWNRTFQKVNVISIYECGTRCSLCGGMSFLNLSFNYTSHVRGLLVSWSLGLISISVYLLSASHKVYSTESLDWIRCHTVKLLVSFAALKDVIMRMMISLPVQPYSNVYDKNDQENWWFCLQDTDWTTCNVLRCYDNPIPVKCVLSWWKLYSLERVSVNSLRPTTRFLGFEEPDVILL